MTSARYTSRGQPFPIFSLSVLRTDRVVTLVVQTVNPSFYLPTLLTDHTHAQERRCRAANVERGMGDTHVTVQGCLSRAARPLLPSHAAPLRPSRRVTHGRNGSAPSTGAAALCIHAAAPALGSRPHRGSGVLLIWPRAWRPWTRHGWRARRLRQRR